MTENDEKRRKELDSLRKFYYETYRAELLETSLIFHFAMDVLTQCLENPRTPSVSSLSLLSQEETMQDATLSVILLFWSGAFRSIQDYHLSWVSERARNGWSHGPVYDKEMRTDPRMASFSELDDKARLAYRVMWDIAMTLKPKTLRENSNELS